MFGEILALEEPDIITVSIRPGVVDTEMQGVIREKGKNARLGFFFSCNTNHCFVLSYRLFCCGSTNDLRF